VIPPGDVESFRQADEVQAILREELVDVADDRAELPHRRHAGEVVTAPTDPVTLAEHRERKNARARIPARPLTIDPTLRAHYYNRRFLDRPPLASTREWVVGAWATGAYWKNSNPLHGAYPRTYLERVHAMFPDARHVLHAFSGGLGIAEAIAAYSSGIADPGEMTVAPESIELIDLKGPDEGRHPTWQGDVLSMPAEWAGRFDLVLADPPYTPEDAARYGVPMPDRLAVTRALRRVTMAGGVLAWLDTVWPMHRKEEWRCWGHVAVVRSTNHRVRLCSLFEAV